MIGEKRLRLYHVTDLHFGAGLWEKKILSKFPGWEVHDFDVISHLSDSIHSNSLECNVGNIIWRIICSGDLTTWGTPAALGVGYDFLSNRSISPGIPNGVCLPDPKAPFIPGNHDIWDGRIPFINLKRRSILDHRSYKLLYGLNAIYATRIDGEPYPYCLQIYQDDSIEVRLYGLDSTRLDLSNTEPSGVLRAFRDEIAARLALSPETVEAIRDALRALLPWYTNEDLRRAIASAAVGCVDFGQLDRLTRLIEKETSDKSLRERKLVRVAMIHHPMTYPHTSSEEEDWHHDPVRGLHGMRDVQETLQWLQFSCVLCGHQHKGFVKSVRPIQSLPPLCVFSCGTSGQFVKLSDEDYNLISSDSSTLTESQISLRDIALQKLNEWASYDLVVSDDKYYWRISRSRFMPDNLKFNEPEPDAEEPVRLVDWENPPL